MKKKFKKISVFVGILGILLVTVGITYAVFSYSKSGIKGNSITSGNIVFHYKEESRGISLTDAMPTVDYLGTIQNNYFDFTITSNTTSESKIPYYITVKRKENDNSLDGAVKLYLTEVNNNNETPVMLSSNKDISFFNELDLYTNAALNINEEKNEKLLYVGEVPTNNSNFIKNYRLRMWLNDSKFDGEVLNYEQRIVGFCSDTTYTTREACVAANKDWTDVATSVQKSFTITVNVYSDGKAIDTSNTLLTKLKGLVKNGDYISSNSDGNWGLIQQQVSVTKNEVLGINDSAYTNIVYTGANPNNFVEFNGEIWRIIGVFNEDSHGQSGQQLVKIIRNNPIIEYPTESRNKTMWDFKNGFPNQIGSSVASGSNEWSDSQLMFMLNGPSAINKGKIYNGNRYTYSVTQNQKPIILASYGGPFYNTIYNNALGNYLSYDENGNAYTNKTVIIPSEAKPNNMSTLVDPLEKTLSKASQEMIADVIWHLGGKPTIIEDNLVSNFYNSERDIDENENTQNVHSKTSTQRSVVWEGKIGLMYPSDYGYAVGGVNRDNCLQKSIVDDWNSGCFKDDWLSYTGATGTSKGSIVSSWTITPYSNYYNRVFTTTYGVWYDTVNMNYAIRPTLYLKADVSIEKNQSDGSYDNPYRIIYE